MNTNETFVSFLDTSEGKWRNKELKSYCIPGEFFSLSFRIRFGRVEATRFRGNTIDGALSKISELSSAVRAHSVQSVEQNAIGFRADFWLPKYHAIRVVLPHRSGSQETIASTRTTAVTVVAAADGNVRNVRGARAHVRDGKVRECALVPPRSAAGFAAF